MAKAKYISASRMKTLETCSWLYYGKYHLNLPDKTNDGAIRGSICHLVFELLLEDKHRKHYDRIMEGKCTEASEPVTRLVVKHLKKQNAFNEENFEMCMDMIVVGLKFDFFCEGSDLGESELRFEIHNKEPEYRIMGFIDKHAVYDEDEKTIKIVDYKSSKAKFRGDDLTSNVQGMMYSLAARHKWPEAKRRLVQFLFLRFPRQPIQELEFSDAELNGFEQHLASVYQVINNFNYEYAKTNFAKDNPKNSWLCGRGKWVCPHKNPYDYYVVLDKNQRVVHTSYNDDFENLKEGQTVEKRHYEGCPRFYSAAGKQEDPFEINSTEDPFDF